MPLTSRLTYAIGDVHGRADLLTQLVRQIRVDVARRRRPGERPLVVLLGDYVDRGLHSRDVIDQLIALAAEPEIEARFLLGNHEDAMIDYLDGRISGAGWGRHGGGNTLRSYGIEAPSEPSREAWSALRDSFRAAVPLAHRAFLAGLELMVQEGRLLFVHAGIRPDVALEAQTKRDLLWIRTEFLEAERADPWLVVHGHTPRSEAYAGPGRLCLDSGGYMTGRLTAAVFDEDTVMLIESGRSSPRRINVKLAS